MANSSLIPHLFRTEYSKIVSVLCKTYGFKNIQLAEDITSNTFLKATETWGLKGIPENPTAWLYKVAKNNAKDILKRESIYQQKIKPLLQEESKNYEDVEIDLSENNIKDSQILMLFAICNSSISNEAQITLSLRILCGFGIEEIANALLTSKATINKRLSRAKNSLKTANFNPSDSNKEFDASRIKNVFSILYLLFNEGYYSQSNELSVQKELCFEAMRLLYILIENSSTNSSDASSLMALFCFHSSRLDTRIDEDGAIVLFDDQDQEKWNQELINKGKEFLQKTTDSNCKYFYEAFIAFWHMQKNYDENLKWKNILQLYNQLIQIEYSPITALNRTYALSRVHGKEKAIEEALKINLTNSHLYHILVAELYAKTDYRKKIGHLEKALQIAKTKNDKSLVQKKIDNL